MKIPVGISKRHVHLTKENYIKLFGTDKIEVRNYLNQPGEFASKSTVDLKWNNKVIEKVRVVGPFRNYSQVELSYSDSEILEVKLETRKSGDVKNSDPIILIGPKGEVELSEGLIIPESHIHISPELAKENNFVDEECILIYQGDKKLFDGVIRICSPSFTEVHINVDEADGALLKQGDEVEVFKCGKLEI